VIIESSQLNASRDLTKEKKWNKIIAVTQIQEIQILSLILPLFIKKTKRSKKFGIYFTKNGLVKRKL